MEQMTHVVLMIIDGKVTEYTRTNDYMIALGFANIYWLRRLGADVLLVVDLATGEILHRETEFRAEYRRNDSNIPDLVNKLFTI